MRLWFSFLLFVPAAALVAGPVARVSVAARVPLIAMVEGPAQVVLAPGDEVRVPVRIAANTGWALSVQSPNAHVLLPPGECGSPGGAQENIRELCVRCSRTAPGPQAVTLVYTLVAR